MDTSSAASAVANSEKRRFQLPEPCSLVLEGKCVIEYIDIAPQSPPPHSGAPLPTIVLLHGAPGTYKDFRQMIAVMQPHARVVGLNLPGFGRSRSLNSDDVYESVTPSGTAALVYEALTQILGKDKDVFLLGHSLGGHAAINVASLAAQDGKLNIRGVILLASAGHRPHQGLWTKTSAVIANAVRAPLPMIPSAGKAFARFVFNNYVEGFAKNQSTSYYVSTVIRNHYTDFSLVKKQLRELKQRQVPTFIAWAKDDAVVEDAIFQELSVVCHDGPRLEFETGGHSVQKVHAKALATAIVPWMQEVVGKQTNQQLTSKL
ncbi:Serine protease family s33, partial [Globisporangium splendens]